MQNNTPVVQEHLLRELIELMKKTDGLMDYGALRHFFKVNNVHAHKPASLARTYPELFKIASDKFGTGYFTLLKDDFYMCKWIQDILEIKEGEFRVNPACIVRYDYFEFSMSDILQVTKRNGHRFEVVESREEVCIRKASCLQSVVSPKSVENEVENDENRGSNNTSIHHRHDKNNCNSYDKSNNNTNNSNDKSTNTTNGNNNNSNCEPIDTFVSWLKSRGGFASFSEVASHSAVNSEVARAIRSKGLKAFIASHSCLSIFDGKDLVVLVEKHKQALQDMISWLGMRERGTRCTSEMTTFYLIFYLSAKYIRRLGVQTFVRSNPAHFELNGNIISVKKSLPQSGPAATVAQRSSSTAKPTSNNSSSSMEIRPTLLCEKSKAEQDKNGIHIEPKVAEVSSSGFIPKLPVQITVECDPSATSRAVSGVSLHNVAIFDPRKNAPATQMRVQLGAKLLPLQMFPSTSYKVNVEWSMGCPKGPIQIHVAEVQFLFFSEVSGWFTISRFIALDAGGGEVVDGTVVDSIRPESEYFQKKPPTPLVFSSMPSYPRVDGKPSLFPIQLPRVELDRNPDVSILDEEFVTLENYLPRFQTLLHLNAASEAAVLEQNVIRSQKPKVRPEYKHTLWFHMGGLGERRPSVLPRDKANVEVVGLSRTVGGVVRYVEATQIGICFRPRDYDLLVNRYVNVGFAPDSFSFKMMHYALGNAVHSGLVERLFDYDHPLPEISQEVANSNLRILQTLQCFTKLNEFQQEAIKTITTKMPPSRRQPFLLFGPPGTGKTTTLVSAVACLLHLNGKRVRVLISAPSNTACDVFRDKLKQTLNEMKTNGKVARVMSSVLADKNQPEPAEVVEAQIVIATCVTAGRLESLPGYFTHVFVDEAGQCTEPEVLIPLNFVGKTGQIVLGGDHKQLGPVVLDKLARGKGHFDVSLFESLMLSKQYDPLRSSNNDLCRMLRLNYRSHEHLVRVPSDLFYGGQLFAGASKARESLTRWRHLPAKDVPLVLHHVKGKEDRENNSPSWFNVAECVQVVEYIKKLMTTFVAQEEIAVIAPYQGQVRKLRKLLAQVGLTRCRVDTVEKLQGDEARVTIVSTCRSSSMNDDYDAMYHVGFLKNEKRMNVAITRARELLIVVGNLEVLKNDPHWKRLVDFAHKYGATVGY